MVAGRGGTTALLLFSSHVTALTPATFAARGALVPLSSSTRLAPIVAVDSTPNVNSEFPTNVRVRAPSCNLGWRPAAPPTRGH